MCGNVKAAAWLVLAAVVLSLGENAARADDKKAIVGRWDNPIFEGCYLRFKDDGTFRWVGLIGSLEGNYRILEKGVLELDTPGTFYGRNVSEFKYKLDGDTFEFLGAKHKRVK